MTLRLLCILSLLVLSNFYSLGQAFEPGLLVKSNGDTLRGDIENGFWNEPPTFIRYRPSADRPSQVFKPRQLRAVSFNGGRYFRFEALPIDHAADTRLDRIANRSLPNVKTDSLLAEVLIEGPVTMFRVVRPGSTHYLLSRPGRAVLDLSPRKYMRKSENGSMTLVEGNNYRGQLAVYFNDCPEASSIAQTAAFTADGVAAVVQAYNQTCSFSRQPGSSWLRLATPRRAISFQGGVLLGTRYNRIRSSSDFGGSCIDCQVRPFGGFYMDLLQAGRGFALHGELSVSPFRQPEFLSSPNGSTSVSYRPGWLGTSRLGIRYFFLLPREQQLLVGLGYELNVAWVPGSNKGGVQALLRPNQLVYAVPVTLPHASVGWRSQRVTLSLDGQMYADANYFDTFLGTLVGSNFAVRLSAGYRLGSNPDAASGRSLTK
jgi:hypothetical protein